jgi:type II secretory pathway pseudopilin PulG
MKKNKNSAFTLVEIMIAGALLAIGAVALVASLISSTNVVVDSQALSVGNRAAALVLENLRGQKNYNFLYNNFKNVTATSAFFINSDSSINWATANPSSPPSGSLGYGYLEFVTRENGYTVADWGTATAFNTSAGGCIDLDGDGATSSNTFVLGRTSETSATPGYYCILPVKVVIRVYRNVAKTEYVEIIRKTWLVNNYEANN